MNGTFLNFFECKFNMNEVEVYVIDYIDKEQLIELKEKYPKIFFYRYGGDKIYFWCKTEYGCIPEELNEIKVHIKIKDYPQIFKVMLLNGVVSLFERNNATVVKEEYSGAYKINSGKNIARVINGLEVNNLLIIDAFYSNEYNILGITLSLKLENKFIWDRNQLIKNKVDVRDLKGNENEIFCNKKALNRFLESTNNTETYKNIVNEQNSTSNQYEIIQKTYQYINNHKEEIYINKNFKLTDIITNNLPYRNNIFKIEKLNIPNHYYYLDKTQNGRYDIALSNLKPYTYENFEMKEIQCAIMCPKIYEGIEEIFSQKLKRKLKEIFHINIILNKYYIDDTNLGSYEGCLYSEIIPMTKNIDITMIVLEEKHKLLNVEKSPYYYCKAKLIGQGIPSQEILVERIKYVNDYILNNIALNIYAKIGGTAWTIEKIEREKQEFIIGISSSIDRKREKIFGVSQIFEYNGNYIVTDCSPLTNMNDYERTFEEYIEKTIRKNLIDTGMVKNEVRLIFHINKSPSSRYEIKAINNVVKKFDSINISYAIVHLNYNHNFRFFTSNENKKGNYIIIDNNKSLLMLSDKSINPLLIDMDSRSTFKDLDYVTKQIYWFCHLSFRSFIPSKKTVTMQYPYLITKLTNELKYIDGWDFNVLRNIGDKLWFL